MSNKKFYVVWRGNNPGIYFSWAECQNEIKNVKGALYKSFKNLEEAKDAFSNSYEDYKKSIRPKRNYESRQSFILKFNNLN